MKFVFLLMRANDSKETLFSMALEELLVAMYFPNPGLELRLSAKAGDFNLFFTFDLKIHT